MNPVQMLPKCLPLKKLSDVSMKVCIIGAGAMGTLYGMRLAMSGVNVCFVEKNEIAIANIQRQGLRMSGIDGDHEMPFTISSNAAALDPVDVVFVHTDTNNTRAAGEQAQQILKSSGFAITFQNGIGNVETLQNMLGHNRVLGGISYHSARLHEPGHSVHTNANTTWIGELNGQRSTRARQLATVLNNAGFSVELTESIDAVIWTKFVLNCAVNPICALTGCRTGEIGLSPTGRRFQSLVLDELLRLLQAKKIEPTDSDLRATIDGFSGRLFNKPSMLQHMENGLETEIDSLNGAAVREAAALGLHFPYNEAVTLLIKTRNEHVIKMLAEPAIDYEALEAAARKT